MSEKPKPNRLINEKSPYLLQHAYNPVDWYAWGEEAFEKAAREDKLVFLSIGYATCHWCHVMERESFEDEETAALMNEHFVAIKVDREERPDIDSIYMDALHAMGQQGGWPLNVFITPGKRPVFGGTYFPPTPRYGMRSFKEILQAASEAWQTKKDKLIDASNDIADYLANMQSERPSAGLPSEESPEHAFQQYKSLFDEKNYGFATDSRNKFPPSMALSFLMNYYNKTGAGKALEMVEATLNTMKKGGIYDQVGGGLCRYSTDHEWLVPHFEKMLYDNSLFLKALAECFQLTNDDFFKQAAYDVIAYVQRDMTVKGGGIASAEDADSEGEEGKFYIWSLEEFREVTGDDSPILESLWHVTAQGNFEGKNILHEDIHTLSEPNPNAEIILANRKKLLDRRSARPRPLRDDKVLTSWNCLYIQALVKAAMAFGDQELTRNAENIYTFLSQNLSDPNGRLMRRYRDGEIGVLGYLSDYAEMGLASFELFRATQKITYLRMAQKLTEDAIRLFKSDFGPFFETGTDSEDLLRRTINGYDGVEPSGNSSMAKLLLLLSSIGIQSDRHTAAAEGIFRHFKTELERQPISCPALLQAYALYLNPPVEVVLIGKMDNTDIQRSVAFLGQKYGDAIVVCADPADLKSMEPDIPILAGKIADGDFTAYVCINRTCKPPVYSLEELKSLICAPE